jgi:hypothetical protein
LAIGLKATIPANPSDAEAALFKKNRRDWVFMVILD